MRNVSLIRPLSDASRRHLFLCVFVCLIGTRPNSLHAAGTINWSDLTLRQTNGELVVSEPSEIRVICFLGTECPLARLYGPRLQAMAERYSERDVVFLGINSNVQDSPAEIDAYAKKYSVQFSMVKDADQSIANAFEATRTPEVYLVDSKGLVRYQGRIDDQYEPGIVRDRPTEHELRDAIESLLANKPVAKPKTVGVGCLITRVNATTTKPDSPNPITFNRDIAPILNANCVECHRSGEIAPMELTDYDEVVGWGQMILEVIDQKRMPPWHADPSIGHFVGERKMSPEDRDTIASWLDQGMVQGDPDDLPAGPTWQSGWQFPTQPDFEIAMRHRPFEVPAEGIVEYQYFVVDPKWETDHWIKAAQVVPGNAAVVHHAIVFVRPPDQNGMKGAGWMGAYVPGQRAVSLPKGHARLVPAGSKLVFQMHYTPTGRSASDITKVGVWQVPESEVTHEVFTDISINHEFEIPADASDYKVEMSVNSFPPNSRMLGITPHMHLRGKSFELVSVKSDGNRKPLLSVPAYDFNWQHWYEFANPVDLNETAALEMRVTFDNSKQNPFISAVDEPVFWGDQTWEEMAVAFYDVAIPRGGPRRRSHAAPKLTDAEAQSKQRRVEEYVQTFFSKLDANRDGVVEREEAPVTLRQHGFRDIDRNNDRRIERKELARAVSKLL